MTVSSYLEAFLTVYGWDMYYVFYLLFASIGLFLYPYLRILNDVYIGYVSGSEYAGTNYLRQLMASILMATLVFFLALVPIMSIDLNSTVVKSVCAERKDVMERRGEYFNNTETRVPIMPYLAMSIGHGINSVIYQQGTCLTDITDAHKATMATDLSEAENPQQLQNELGRFSSECHNKARTNLKGIIAGKYGDTASKIFKKGLKNTIDNLVASTGNDDRKAHEIFLMTNYDSPLIRDFFYSEMSPLRNFEATKGLVLIKADQSVEGIAGAGDGSQRQGKETPPECNEWWEGSNGLRYRLIQAMSDSVAVNMANDLGHPSCQNDRYVSIRDGGNGAEMSSQQKEKCATAVKQAIFNGNDDSFVMEMFKAMQGGTSDSPLSTADNAKMTTATTALTAAAVVEKIPVIGKYFGNLGGSQALSQIAGFYMTIFLLKLMLNYFVPMILMSVYMFWGIYLIVGEFKGMTMIRGMILIIAVVMMPALWAIVEHLDDGLYSAMYGGSVNVTDVFNRALLDITTGIFQIAIVFVLFYLIGEAGGGNARGVVGADQGMADRASRGIGSSAGGSLSNAGVGATKGAGRFAGGVGRRTWNKLKPKPKYKIGPY